MDNAGYTLGDKLVFGANTGCLQRLEPRHDGRAEREGNGVILDAVCGLGC